MLSTDRITRYELYTGESTPVFGDMLQDGFDWGRTEYLIPGNLDNKTKNWLRHNVNAMIEHKYMNRNICYKSPGLFKNALVNRMNEAWDKHYIRIEALMNSADMTKLVNEVVDNFVETNAKDTESQHYENEYPQNQIVHSDDPDKALDYLAVGQQDLTRDGSEKKNDRTTTSTNAVNPLSYMNADFIGVLSPIVDHVSICFSMFVDSIY